MNGTIETIINNRVMKKNIIASIVGVAAAGLLLTSCSGKPESVTAVVAGPDGQPAAVVVKYAKAVSAESVSADAFQIEGQEVEAVFVTDKDITAAPEKPECKGEKPECDTTKACPDAKAECDKAKAGCDKAKPECDGQHKDCTKEAQCDSTKAQCDSSKVECEKAAKPECEGPKSVDGQFVVIVLKKAECDKAKAECDSTKAACPEAKVECDKAKAECDKAEKPECDGQHKDCAKEAGKAHDCGMDPKECEANNHECCPEEKAQCDSTKACPEAAAKCDSSKVECEKAGKPDCKEGKSEKCPEIAVPAVSVKQVKEIKAADGSALKAWSKAFPATKAVPCFKKGPKHHHHYGEACGEACPEEKK